MYEPKPTDWIVDGTINLTHICRDANWDLGIAIRATHYAGLSKDDAEDCIRFVFGLRESDCPAPLRSRLSKLKDIQCQNRKP